MNHKRTEAIKPKQTNTNNMEKGTLSYVCKATKQRHNKKGVLYRHVWATGFQELVFDSHFAAHQWAKSNNLKVTQS